MTRHFGNRSNLRSNALIIRVHCGNKITLQLLANAGYVFLLQCLPYFHSHMNHQIKRFSIFYLWTNRQTDYGLKFRYSWKSVHCRICTPKWKSLSKLQRSNSLGGGGSGEKVRETTRRTDRPKKKVPDLRDTKMLNNNCEYFVNLHNTG